MKATKGRGEVHTTVHTNHAAIPLARRRRVVAGVVSGRARQTDGRCEATVCAGGAADARDASRRVAHGASRA